MGAGQIAPGRILSETAEGLLELTVVYNPIIPEIFVPVFAHDGEGRLVAAFAAHTDTSCMSACISVGGFPHGPYPVIPSVVFACLFFKPFPHAFFDFFFRRIAFFAFRVFAGKHFFLFLPLLKEFIHVRLIHVC